MESLKALAENKNYNDKCKIVMERVSNKLNYDLLFLGKRMGSYNSNKF